ncbi:MAG: acyl carrier protein [Ruminococcaceae bacterium]|nr:acyl carrier protein [Oscillospiraceae bacterium]MBQ9969268.1 acyl carrier protein [Oscillospiraceae bacterium]
MDVLEKIIDILCDQLDLDREQVTEDSEIIDDLGADSLDIVDLIMTLEDEFDTEITDEMVEGMKTVGDIARFVEEHL